MNITFFVLVALLCIVYIQLSQRVSDKFTILQTSTDTILPEHIIEKLPILVHERIVDPIQLVKTVFKYQFVSIQKCAPPVKQHTINCAYYVVHAKEKSHNDVFIKHPKMSNIVNCQMDQHSVLLVPNKWVVQFGNPKHFDVFECHSVLTKLFYFCNV